MALVDIAPMSFLLILFLIVVSGFGSKPKKHRSKKTLRCICVVWGVGRNLEYHTYLEGWSSFLILSCLSVVPTRADVHCDQTLSELQDELKNFTPLFSVSKAYLYAPWPLSRANGINCTKKFMYCYLLELDVVLHEENYTKDNQIESFKEEYSSSTNFKCLPCEAYDLVDARTFLKRMEQIIQQLRSLLPNLNSTCV